MKLLKALFLSLSHFLASISSLRPTFINKRGSVSSLIRSSVFMVFALTTIKVQALPFDSSCSFKLSPAENLDTIVDLVVHSEMNFESRVQTLFVYINQNRPNLFSQDIEEILEFILLNEQHTDFNVEPSNLFQALVHIMSFNSAVPPAVLKIRDLSMQSQILLWLLDTHIKDYTTIANAIMVGNIHRFILEDIKRLQPGRNEQHYRLELTRVLSLNFG